MTVLPMNLFAHLILSMATAGWSADSVEVTTVDKASYKAPVDAVLELMPTTREANEKAARLSERITQTTATASTKMGPLEASYEIYESTIKTNVPGGETSPAGSYIRTCLTLTNPTDKDIALDRLYFMKSTPLDAKRAYQVIGNTDGAVVCGTSDADDTLQWIAIEHPMAKYELVHHAKQLVFRRCQKKETYSIEDLTNIDEATGYFYVPVNPTAESISVTFQYTGGNLKALIYGVEALNPKNSDLLAHDIKTGETGNRSINNTYTLSGLTAGSPVVLRVKAGTDGKGSSNGKILLSGATPVASLNLRPAQKKPVVEQQTDTLTAYIPVVDTLRAGESMTFSYVIGQCKDATQFRRVFNTYLNAERAHPHRVLPHYNSWYDLCINRNDAPVEKRFTREEALASMRAFRKELWEERGVFINSYLWDDGWDNFDSLWGFNENFPNGFKELADEAHLVPGASIAVWMSPFGGYGGSFGRRLAYAKKMGIVEPNAPGLLLAKPTYYAAFRDRVLQMIKDYDMNLFKFDRMGSGSDANGAADRYAADLRAVGNLCAEMRAAKQDVFINCTVGTWASPYWLMWCDSIWKGDGDCDYLGDVGTPRQKWVTYRDNVIYDRFVSKSPLFPLNSMMMHGIIVCKSSPWNTMLDYRGTGNYRYKGEGYSTPTACVDFAAEVWMGVALGTGLQEYYITPDFMSETWWDILANGVKWIKENEATLTDAHWIGGDPGSGHDLQKRGNAPKDIYGYASLGDKKGIVILRNPSDKTQTYALNLDNVLEMPTGEGAKNVKPTVIFNSSSAYENEGSATAFKPVWPKDTATTIDWTLPPFTTILFEVEF